MNMAETDGSRPAALCARSGPLSTLHPCRVGALSFGFGNLSSAIIAHRIVAASRNIWLQSFEDSNCSQHILHTVESKKFTLERNNTNCQNLDEQRSIDVRLVPTFE